jgi:hypothetical protein
MVAHSDFEEVEDRVCRRGEDVAKDLEYLVIPPTRARLLYGL